MRSFPLFSPLLSLSSFFLFFFFFFFFFLLSNSNQRDCEELDHLRILSVVVVVKEPRQAFPDRDRHLPVSLSGGLLDHLMEQAHTEEQLGMGVAQVRSFYYDYQVDLE